MKRSRRTRALIALAAVALSLYVALTVPVRLGLDLRGGTQFILETRPTTADETSILARSTATLAAQPPMVSRMRSARTTSPSAGNRATGVQT